MKKRVLVIDIGGTHVKLMISQSEKRQFDSGMKLSPRQLISQIKKTAEGWKYDAISVGFPAPVHNGRIMKDPKHLATGWVDWNFSKTLGKPTRVLNDAAMQALGSYRNGRMLFLGLGTGLGSALVWPKNLLPLELGDLPYEGGIIEAYLGVPGLKRLGETKWKRHVLFCLRQLKLSFIADSIVLGGGNARLFETFPAGIERGHNSNVYRGGLRMWESDRHTGKAKWNVM